MGNGVLQGSFYPTGWPRAADRPGEKDSLEDAGPTEDAKNRRKWGLTLIASCPNAGGYNRAEAKYELSSTKVGQRVPETVDGRGFSVILEVSDQW